ncbi:unnamed protein product [Prunus armeniaca]
MFFDFWWTYVDLLFLWQIYCPTSRLALVVPHLVRLPFDVLRLGHGAGFVLLTPTLPLDKMLLDIQSQEIIGRGVLYETTCPHTPQQNRVVERNNGQILAATRALLLSVSVPTRIWMDVVTYAVYLLNRLPS